MPTAGVKSIGRLALVLAVAVCGPAASAEAITVTNNADSGAGSLRQAIMEAAPGETVVVPPDTYTLTSASLSIATDVTIAGSGAGDTIIRAGGAFRVITVGAGTSVTIRGVTVRDGEDHVPSGVAAGGGVQARNADVTLEGVVLTNNRANAAGAEAGKAGGIAEGGGISVREGTLDLFDSTVSGNTADAQGASGAGGGIAEGGGVYVRNGTLNVRDGAVVANTATAEGGSKGSGSIASGGGIFSREGVLDMLDTMVTDNAADADGGGEAHGGDGDGGGLDASGTFTVVGSTFADNTSDARGGQDPGSPAGLQTGGSASGGGVAASADANSSSSLSAITVDGNVADGSGGSGGGGGFARGGGLEVIANPMAAAIVNATVTGDVSRSLGENGIAEGGGLFGFATKTTLSLTNATLNANGAEAPKASGGDLNANASTTIQNTIVSAGTAPGGSQNCAGSASSLGHNLDSLDQCGFHATGDRTGSDPLLGPLQDNGGPVETKALAAASPAVDAGASGGCPGSDARGVTRPQGAACDIGAYELVQPVPTPPTSPVVPITNVAPKPPAPVLSALAISPAKVLPDLGRGASIARHAPQARRDDLLP